MKNKLFLIVFCISTFAFSQSDIYWYKDTSNSLSLEDIQKEEFQLLEKQILEPYSNDAYWFKIPANQTDSKYVFRILYERIHEEAEAYQNSIQIRAQKSQRFLTYHFFRNDDVYVKIDPKLHSYIPVELKSIENSTINENKQFLINGFYYGFVFLVIILNLCYYFLFKDDAFLYYALFLASVCFGVFTMDGMLNFYNLDWNINNLLMILNYLCLAFFSSKFVNSYLFLDTYYPRLKRYSYVAGAIMIFLGILYLITEVFHYLLLLNIFVFSLLLIYWIFTVVLYNKNSYTKLLSFAYVIILFSAVDFFVLNFLGISIMNSNATTIKLGAFVEMIILSVAVYTE